jgi:hypothetical protein
MRNMRLVLILLALSGWSLFGWQWWVHQREGEGSFTRAAVTLAGVENAAWAGEVVSTRSCDGIRIVGGAVIATPEDVAGCTVVWACPTCAEPIDCLVAEALPCDVDPASPVGP